MFCRIFVICLFLVITTDQSFSQNTTSTQLELGITIHHFPAPLDDPSLPFSIVTIDENTPLWAMKMYLPNPNLFEISKIYESWRVENPNVGGDHVRNYRKLRGYLVLNEFVDENGSVNVLDDLDIKERAKKLRKDRESSLSRYSKSFAQANASWQFLGPDHMKNTSSEDVNRHINIYSISQCLTNTDVLYCTTEDGGTVFKTTDNGDSWMSVSDDLIEDMGDRTIEVSATDPDIVYLGTKHDIFKTTVGGNSWTSIYNSTNSRTRTLLVHPTNPDTVYAGGQNGILKSTDGGATWTNPLPNRLIHDIRYQPGSTTVMYALINNSNLNYTEFYKSIDGGNTWTLKTNGWPTEASTKDIGGQMTTSDGHPHIIFAFIGADWTDSDNTRNIKILKSSDFGETWTTKVDYDNVKNINSGQGYYDWDIEMSDIDSNIVALGTQNSWISYDGFETVTTDIRHGWSPHADIQEMLFNGSEIWVANDGGVVKFDNDSLYNWTVKSKGINAISYWGFDQGWNEDVSCGVHYHNGTSATHTNYDPEVAINFGGAEPHFALVSHNGDKIVSKGYGSVNGYTMPELQNGTYNRFSYNLTPNSDYVIGNNGAVHPAYYNTHFQPNENRIMKSEDFGITWDTLYTFSASDDYVWDIRMTRADPKVFFVSTLRSSGSGGANVYKSEDGGLTFSKVNFPAWFDNDPKIISIEVSNENKDVLFAMKSRYGTKVAKSIDGGSTWTDITTSSLDGYTGQKILIADGTDGGIYLTAGRAIFYRNNTFSDWIMLSDGLPANAWTRFIKPFYRDGEVKIASNRGVFKADLYDTPSLSNALVQPSVSQKSTNCSRDTFYFDDYSVVNHEGATWSWSFPGASYVSSTTSKSPKVIYSQSGIYDVTMSITQGGSTYTKTVPQMVSINDECKVDSLPGLALSLTGHPEDDQDFMITDDLNLTTNTFSFTGWIKPQDSLRAFAGIFSNGVWCAHCNDETLGLIINYWGGHLWYRWPGSTSGWASRTDLSPNVDEWNYMAMVVSPDSVKVYLNDKKWISHIAHQPTEVYKLYLGKGFYSKYFKGLMDEVTFWSKSLTDEEVRELKHLTKDPTDHPDLLAYYQFNKESNQVLDKSKIYRGTLQGDAHRTISTVPVGEGQRAMNKETNGIINYAEAGVEINYSSENNADIVISKIQNKPYLLPLNFNQLFDKQYWVLDRYGTGSYEGTISFTLDENLLPEEANDKDQFVLLSRAAHSDGQWIVIDTATVVDTETNKVTFDNISASYSQFLIGKMNADCLTALIISNRNDLSGSHHASEAIYAGNLYEDGDVTIRNGENVSFKAKQHISLMNGFQVEIGAVLDINIEGCPE